MRPEVGTRPLINAARAQVGAARPLLSAPEGGDPASNRGSADAVSPSARAARALAQQQRRFRNHIGNVEGLGDERKYRRML
jgi:hypothetical protein